MATNPLPTGFRFYKALMATYAAKYQLDARLVASLVWKESTFCTDAYRFEPDYWNRYMKANPRFANLNPRRVSASYGLMQVMYTRLFENHVPPEDQAWQPEFLFVPENGLDIGCGLLAELMAWATALNVPAQVVAQEPKAVTLTALAAYNGGRGGNAPRLVDGVLADWPLRNGTYAKAVMGLYDQLQAEYPAVA